MTDREMAACFGLSWLIIAGGIASGAGPEISLAIIVGRNLVLAVLLWRRA